MWRFLHVCAAVGQEVGDLGGGGGGGGESPLGWLTGVIGQELLTWNRREVEVNTP